MEAKGAKNDNYLRNCNPQMLIFNFSDKESSLAINSSRIRYFPALSIHLGILLLMTSVSNFFRVCIRKYEDAISAVKKKKNNKQATEIWIKSVKRLIHAETEFRKVVMIVDTLTSNEINTSRHAKFMEFLDLRLQESTMDKIKSFVCPIVKCDRIWAHSKYPFILGVNGFIGNLLTVKFLKETPIEEEEDDKIVCAYTIERSMYITPGPPHCRRPEKVVEMANKMRTPEVHKTIDTISAHMHVLIKNNERVKDTREYCELENAIDIICNVAYSNNVRIHGELACVFDEIAKFKEEFDEISNLYQQREMALHLQKWSRVVKFSKQVMRNGSLDADGIMQESLLGYVPSLKRAIGTIRRCYNISCRNKEDGDSWPTCGGCRVAFYCSVECQRMDYSSHKLMCKGQCFDEPLQEYEDKSKIQMMEIGFTS